MLYQKTSKINWLLILQGWTMLWVVIGHSPLSAPHTETSSLYSDILFDIAYSFHMPMFIFISGYLFYMTRIQKCTPYFKMIREKIIRLGVPYLFFTLIALVMKSCFSAEMDRPTELSFRELGHAFLYPDDGPVSGFWFLAVIMWCFLFAPLWKLLLRRLWTIILGLVASLALCLWVPWFADNILCFPKFLTHSFYFFLGIVACRYALCEIKQPGVFFGTAASLLVFTILSIFRIHGLEVVVALSGMCFSICLARILSTYLPGAFSSFRNYTYQIYLMAIFFQIVCKILFRHFNIDNFAAYVSCVLVGLYLPVLTSMAIQKINFAPLYLLVGMNKPKEK